MKPRVIHYRDRAEPWWALGFSLLILLLTVGLTR